MELFNASVYKKRREALMNLIPSGLILILGNEEASINAAANVYRYRQDSNFLYFFGINAPGFAGIIDVDNGKEYLFGEDFQMDDIIWMGNQPSVAELAQRVGVDNTRKFNDLHSFIAEEEKRKIHFLPPHRATNKLLLENLLGVKTTFLKKKASVELIKAIVKLRSIKDAQEIAEINKACDIAYDMHVTAMRLCKPGTYEREIAGTIEGIALAEGGATSFPIILSQNGEILHNHYHGNRLTKGKLMLTDAGAETSMGYASDFTRTVPVGGQFSQQQKEIYEIVLKANEYARMLTSPKIYYKTIHLEICKLIVSGLKELGLMKGDVDEAVKCGAHALFMPHGLGHMMGLDVHDMEDLGEDHVGYNMVTKRSDQFGLAYLRMGRLLSEGHVVTNEPGIYFIPALIQKWQAEKLYIDFINYDKLEDYHDFGGIRLEDDLLVTKNGCTLLGKERIPITIEEIESIVPKA